MSGFGVFESADAQPSRTPKKANREQRRKASSDDPRAIRAAVAQIKNDYGQFLSNAKTAAEFNERWSQIGNDIPKKVAEHVFPKPAVLRKVKAAVKPDFSKQAETKQATFYRDEQGADWARSEQDGLWRPYGWTDVNDSSMTDDQVADAVESGKGTVHFSSRKQANDWQPNEADGFAVGDTVRIENTYDQSLIGQTGVITSILPGVGPAGASFFIDYGDSENSLLLNRSQISKAAASKTARVAGWKQSKIPGVYIAQDTNTFTCPNCQTKHSAMGKQDCKCGKIWNLYTIEKGAARTLYCREVPERRDAILAKRKTASFSWTDNGPNDHPVASATLPGGVTVEVNNYRKGKDDYFWTATDQDGNEVQDCGSKSFNSVDEAKSDAESALSSYTAKTSKKDEKMNPKDRARNRALAKAAAARKTAFEVGDMVKTVDSVDPASYVGDFSDEGKVTKVDGENITVSYDGEDYQFSADDLKKSASRKTAKDYSGLEATVSDMGSEMWGTQSWMVQIINAAGDDTDYKVFTATTAEEALQQMTGTTNFSEVSNDGSTKTFKIAKSAARKTAGAREVAEDLCNSGSWPTQDEIENAAQEHGIDAEDIQDAVDDIKAEQEPGYKSKSSSKAKTAEEAMPGWTVIDEDGNAVFQVGDSWVLFSAATSANVNLKATSLEDAKSEALNYLGKTASRKMASAAWVDSSEGSRVDVNGGWVQVTPSPVGARWIWNDSRGDSNIFGPDMSFETLEEAKANAERWSYLFDAEFMTTFAKFDHLTSVARFLSVIAAEDEKEDEDGDKDVDVDINVEKGDDQDSDGPGDSEKDNSDEKDEDEDKALKESESALVEALAFVRRTREARRFAKLDVEAAFILGLNNPENSSPFKDNARTSAFNEGKSVKTGKADARTDRVFEAGWNAYTAGHGVPQSAPAAFLEGYVAASEHEAALPLPSTYDGTEKPTINPALDTLLDSEITADDAKKMLDKQNKDFEKWNDKVNRTPDDSYMWDLDGIA